MDVKALIEELQKCPQDSEVCTGGIEYLEWLIIQSPCRKGIPIDNRKEIYINL